MQVYVSECVGVYTEINEFWGFWWLSGEGSACQCRRHGFSTWPGKSPHIEKQLGLCATATEACVL